MFTCLYYICSNQIYIQFLFTTCLTFSLLTTCRSGKCIIILILYYRYMNKSISVCVHVCQISGHASNFITSVTLYIWACGHSCHSLMIQCLSLAGHLSCLTNEHNMTTVDLENFGVKIFVKLINTSMKLKHIRLLLYFWIMSTCIFLPKCMLNVCDNTVYEAQMCT